MKWLLIARQRIRMKQNLTFVFETPYEGITGKSHRAATYRIVVYNLAASI
jgi:hypothetical protein